MNRTAFLLTLVASILLVLLVAACGGDDDDGTCGFGGDYPFGGPTPVEMNPTERANKIADFGEYQVRDLAFSQAVELKNSGQFERSVKQNLTSPYGLTGQLYNYVITIECKIFVAEWTKEAAKRGNTEFREALTEKASTTKKCPGGREFLPVTSKGTMINFYPEDLAKEFRDATKETPQSPCWLGSLAGGTPVPGERINGILDALSKHFMLVQENGRIDTFNEDEWKTPQVAYAGEVFVDPASCTFTLNNNSGTYRPIEDPYLPTVTMFFANELNQGSLKLSGIGNWC